ncbi:MAG: hypothetical protein PHY02_06635 [Phycisphaerae bacterium]|nr:hypothetical protein [Phycisphaerae bacterium]
MSKKTIQLKEGVLWKLHEFVIGNCLGIRDACYLLEAVKKGKQVIYQMDFSDIHPYIFPGKTREDIERERASSHGLAVKFMWDLLLNVNNPSWEDIVKKFPFRLAITPATRLEALEALWHAEKRIYRKFRKYASDIIPHIKFKKDSVSIPESEVLYERMKTWDYKKFLPKLRQAISDETIKRYLQEPVDTLTWLIDSGVLQNLEEFLPDMVLYDIQKMEYPSDISCYTEILYKHKPRSDEKRIWTREHDFFHDKVDELNINLAYSIAKSESAKEFYVPMLTHTGRLIRVGTWIMDFSKHLIVNHSLAPLYIARAIREHPSDDLPSFLNLGRALIIRIAKEMRQIKELNEVLALNYTDLNERIKEGRLVDINESLVSKLELFSREYYDLIDSIGKKPSDKEYEEIGPKRIGIEDIFELFNKALKTAKVIRGTAADLKSTFEEQNCVLAGIFEPINHHAKEISDWLIRKDNIDLIEEFEKINF